MGSRAGTNGRGGGNAAALLSAAAAWNDGTMTQSRRSFLAAITAAPIRSAESPVYDVVVYGGTAAGIMAAIEVSRMGRRAVLIEPGRHIGGLTSGGLGATDYGKKDAIGGLAREFYSRVKRHYLNDDAWKQEQRNQYRCAGHDWDEDVMWRFEPHIAERLLRDVAREARVEIVHGERLNLGHGVRKTGQRVDAMVMESGRRFAGRVFIDATYEGDLMAKAGVSYAVGRESNSQYGESQNGVQRRKWTRAGGGEFGGHFLRAVDPFVRPGDRSSGLLFGVHEFNPAPDGTGDRRVQAYNYRLCLTHVPSNRVAFSKPPGYDPHRYELLLRLLTSEERFPQLPGLPAPEHPVLGKDVFRVIMPNRKTDSNTKGAAGSDFVGMNWEYPEGDYRTRARIIREHIDYHQGLLWFVAHDPRVPARYRVPMAQWGYAADEFEDTGHWPHQLYVREARRMVGEYVMTEHDCRGTRVADDSIGLASYGMDSHMTARYVDENGYVQNEGHVQGGVTQPYPVSYRAITPKASECENLLAPVCLAASHPAYGSIRMEPVYMILGQSAGAAV